MVRPAEHDPGVLGCVVRPGLEVAVRRDIQVEPPVPCHEVEHVVEEPDAPGGAAGPGPFGVGGELDAGFPRLTRDVRPSAPRGPFSRTSMEAAWTSKPSARARGAAARASAGAPGPLR